VVGSSWIAANYILRPQLEALDATVVLGEAGLGHVAAGFIRPADDELLWRSTPPQ
jgi:hypothetical protein